MSRRMEKETGIVGNTGRVLESTEVLLVKLDLVTAHEGNLQYS